MWYEIAVVCECGYKGCAVRGAGYAPPPQVLFLGDCHKGHDCHESTARWSRIAFGFGRRIEGDSFQLLDLPNGKSGRVRKAMITNPRDTHTMTMGRFALQMQNLADKFSARCDNDLYSCNGYSMQLLTQRGFAERVLDHPRVAPTLSLPVSKTARYVLFFDGGSRGNPGPGGSGSVVVVTPANATTPTLLWIAAMSYASHSTTNNSAEYQGLLTGLQEAKRRQWAPLHAVGVIIDQMKRRRPPKSDALRPLYRQAQQLADALTIVG